MPTYYKFIAFILLTDRSRIYWSTQLRKYSTNIFIERFRIYIYLE